MLFLLLLTLIIPYEYGVFRKCAHCGQYVRHLPTCPVKN